MYESYYGFIEKPFSLTPDPKYLYRSESHTNALELLQYAINRREGFVVITGDTGTGKTTLCRALVETTDQKTFTALLLNPFVSEEDLLRAILQDLGVISRGEERLQVRQPSKQDLVNTLYDFLLSLAPLGARAVLIIDEAQNLPLQILEQIRIMSNLETDKEKLLQIILVGQLNLVGLLRSPELRQLDQRVSVRYQLKPLSEPEVGAYVSHRLAIANGARGAEFTPAAIRLVHEYSGGVPRLINMLCDRALLGGFTAHSQRIDEDLVVTAAEGLDMRRTVPPRRSLFGRLIGRQRS
jgi:general secretion pathway protein A